MGASGAASGEANGQAAGGAAGAAASGKFVKDEVGAGEEESAEQIFQ